MKKTLTLSLALLLFCFFSGCEQQAASAPASILQASSAPASAAPLAAVKGSIKADTLGGTFTQQGAYDTIMTPNGANIMYIDYATQQQTALCNRPNCTHSDDTCPAWVSSAPRIIVGNNELVLLYRGWKDFEGNVTFGHIETMDFNGQNRKTVYSFPSNIDFSGNVAVDDASIYLMLHVVSQDGKALAGYELAQIDLNEKKKTVLQTYSGDQATFLVGGFNDKLVLKQITTQLDPSNPVSTLEEWKDTFGNQKHAVMLFSPQTGQALPVKEWLQETVKEYYDENILYYATREGSVGFVDMANGQEMVIAPDTPSIAGQAVGVIAHFKDYLLIETVPAEGGANGYPRAVCNINTGEIVANTLQMTGNEMTEPLRVISDAGETLLVVYQRKKEMVDILLADGTMGRDMELQDQYGFIRIDDYANNVMNITPLQRLA